MSRLARGPSFCGTGMALMGRRMASSPLFRLSGGERPAFERAGHAGTIDLMHERCDNSHKAMTSQLATAVRPPLEQGDIDIERIRHHALEREMALHMRAGPRAMASRALAPSESAVAMASASAAGVAGRHPPAGALLRRDLRRRQHGLGHGAEIATPRRARPSLAPRRRERPKASGSVEGTVTTAAARKAAGMSVQWPTRRTISGQPRAAISSSRSRT